MRNELKQASEQYMKLAIHINEDSIDNNVVVKTLGEVCILIKGIKRNSK